MNVEQRCPIGAIGHGAHFWRRDGARVLIQPAPGVLFCPGADRNKQPFRHPGIAEQLTFPT
jgi:hypothetical protein